jgi:poly-gamma-glutamate capsule biosynthesis protein CapA/YwtB (metallophosphatase superfamily)
MKHRHSQILLLCVLVLFSCKTVPEKNIEENDSVLPSSKKTAEQKEEMLSAPLTLTLLFGGDIMAHKPNFHMTDYSDIWKDIAPLVSSADFSFANIESPVDDDLPYSSYPDFNMHHEYPEAAITAGFNVFSLVNNHTNDQGYEGMSHTYSWARKISSEYKSTPRPVYFSGLHDTKNEPVSYEIIRKNSWKILFCAVTEVVNRNDYREYMNYVAPNSKSRKNFEEYVKKIRGENPCDIFILSIHANVPEYVHTVGEMQKKYYYELLDSGVDIIWANHPHVVLEREFVGKKDSGGFSKLILYANGNTISGQRWEPELESPYNEREYTGDGLLYEVVYTKQTDSATAVLTDTKPYYITTYINTAYQFVVKFLDGNFIHYLKSIGRTTWASYISERKKIMEKTKVTKTWL